MASAGPHDAIRSGAAGSRGRERSAASSASRSATARIAGKHRAHPAGDTPVSDAGVRIGKAQRPAGARRSERADAAEPPLTGVFAARSPDRPNPIGIHPVTVKRKVGNRLRIGPIETIDRTPVIDIKPVIGSRASRRALDRKTG